MTEKQGYIIISLLHFILAMLMVIVVILEPTINIGILVVILLFGGTLYNIKSW